MTDFDRLTVTKTRISGHARQSVTQQIVRVDRKSDQLPSLELQQQLAEYIRQQVPSVDAMVCSDYGDGVLTPAVIEAALSHRLAVVDTQKQLARYAGATLFTPNRTAVKAVPTPAFYREHRIECGKRPANLAGVQSELQNSQPGICSLLPQPEKLSSGCSHRKVAC